MTARCSWHADQVDLPGTTLDSAPLLGVWCSRNRPRPVPHAAGAYKIFLRGDAFAIVDEDVVAAIARYSWSLRPRFRTGGFYIVRNFSEGNGRNRKVQTALLHRTIIEAPRGELVDHINGDTLDNRRVNLRLCDARGNSRNRRANVGSMHGLKGVYARKDRWHARIKFNSRDIYLGSFLTAVDAARAYDAAARRYFREFASVNFPVECEDRYCGGPSLSTGQGHRTVTAYPSHIIGAA